jgi:hypothetical protein
MEEFSREFFKNDEVMGTLFQLIKNNHKIASHTVKVLSDNRHIKDFCEESRHFMFLPGEKPLYIHYDVSSWYQEPEGAAIKIESIGVYDDYLEYEVARLKGVHSTSESEGANLN